MRHVGHSARLRSSHLSLGLLGSGVSLIPASESRHWAAKAILVRSVPLPLRRGCLEEETTVSNIQRIQAKFKRIGARADIRPMTQKTFRRHGSPLVIDIDVLRKRRRKGDNYLRQGEWFFIPWPHAKIDAEILLCNAPLVRDPDSKPHLCEFLYQDGQREYECDRYPKLAFFESEYRAILCTRRKASQWNWRQLPFEPDVYVRGWISHPDHNPLHLDVWHRVQRNTEIRDLGAAPQPKRARVVYRD